MSDKPNGGPAFPCQALDAQGLPFGPMQDGITMRDYFAAAALPELIRAALELDHVKWDATVEHAYVIADAALTERMKQ